MRAQELASSPTSSSDRAPSPIMSSGGYTGSPLGATSALGGYSSSYGGSPGVAAAASPLTGRTSVWEGSGRVDPMLAAGGALRSSVFAPMASESAFARCGLDWVSCIGSAAG